MRILSHVTMLVVLVAVFAATGMKTAAIASPLPPCPSLSQNLDCPVPGAPLPGRAGAAEVCSPLLCPEAARAGGEAPARLAVIASPWSVAMPPGPVYGIDKPPKG